MSVDLELWNYYAYGVFGGQFLLVGVLTSSDDIHWADGDGWGGGVGCVWGVTKAEDC